MQAHVHLASGKRCSVAFCSPASSIRGLKAEAQQRLERGQQLDSSSTLNEVGVRDGDSIAAIVPDVNLASALGAYEEHSPLMHTRGDAARGGDLFAELARLIGG